MMREPFMPGLPQVNCFLIHLNDALHPSRCAFFPTKGIERCNASPSSASARETMTAARVSETSVATLCCTGQRVPKYARAPARRNAGPVVFQLAHELFSTNGADGRRRSLICDA